MTAHQRTVTDNFETGMSLIAAERRRQVEVEGYGADHDRDEVSESLVRAAVCYATPAYRRVMLGRRAPIDWPWEADYWKPTPDDRVRELVKAGALIAAEIDRLGAASR